MQSFTSVFQPGTAFMWCALAKTTSKLRLEEVEDRFPVHARRLHRRVCARRVRQPLVKPEQLGGRHAESSHLGLRRPWCSRRHAVTDSL